MAVSLTKTTGSNDLLAGMEVTVEAIDEFGVGQVYTLRGTIVAVWPDAIVLHSGHVVHYNRLRFVDGAQFLS